MNPIPKGEAPASDEMLQAVYQESLPVMLAYAPEYEEGDGPFRALELSAAGLWRLVPAQVEELQIAKAFELDFWTADESMVYRWCGTEGAPFTCQALSLEPIQDPHTAWRQHRDREVADPLQVNDQPGRLSPEALAGILIDNIENARLEHQMQPPFTEGEATALYGLMKVINRADPATMADLIIPRPPKN